MQVLQGHFCVVSSEAPDDRREASGLPRETADPSLSAESLNSGISQGIGLDTLRKGPLNGNCSEKMKEEGKKAEARGK